MRPVDEEVGGLVGRVVHVVDAVLLERTGEAIDEAMLV